MRIERRATARMIKTYKIVIEFADGSRTTNIVNGNDMWDAIRSIKEVHTSRNLTVKFISGQEITEDGTLSNSFIGESK